MRTFSLAGFVALAVICLAWSSAAAPVGAPVYGKVTLEDGRPAAGARVKWLSLDATDGVAAFPNKENEVVCGPDGSFRFEKMRKGPFRLEASARPVSATTELFAVVPRIAEGMPNVKIVMKCGSSLSGRVVDTKGEPVPAFKIGVIQRYKLGGPKDKATATSGPEPREFKAEDGKFTFECLPEGEWEVFVSTGGPVPQKTTPVTLPRTGDPIELIVPPLSEKQALTGRVVDPDGKPVAGASVRASQVPDENGNVSADDKHATTDKDGVFRFEKLRTWPLAFTAKSSGFSRSQVLRLDGTESAVEVVLSLRASCKLSGEVVDASGQPVVDCVVVVLEEKTEPAADTPQTKTDAKGHFELADLPPGVNVVYSVTDEDHAIGPGQAAKRVTLAADAPATVKLKLRAPKK